MAPKIFFVLCILSTLSAVRPSPLTKEITADQSPQLNFRDILSKLERTDVVGEAINFILNNFEDTYSNLTNLISSQNTPDISEVLNIFNLVFGQRVFVLDRSYIQVDPGAYERFLSDKVRSGVENVFQKNLFQQVFVYGALQKQIQNSVRNVRSEIENSKVPLDEINARIASEQVFISTRADLMTTVCESIVTTVFSTYNETISTALEILKSVSIATNDNELVSAALNFISYVIDLIEQGLEHIWELVESFQSSICSFLLSSRKRRDLTSFEDLVDRPKRDTALADTVGVREIAVITTVLWSILSTILSFTLTSFVNSIFSSINTYLLNLLAEWFSGIIDSIL